jgi:hypothetical protein
VENCGTGPQSEKKSDQPLMSCKTLKEKYQDYWNKNQQDPEEPELSERGHIKHELDSCSDNTYFFFIGAGVPPGSKDHGKSFFNGPILQFIYRCLRDNSCSKKKIEAIDKRKIASIGGEVEAPMGDSNLQSPRFVEIDFRSRRLHARFVPVLAVENCKSSGAIVQAEP